MMLTPVCCSLCWHPFLSSTWNAWITSVPAQSSQDSRRMSFCFATFPSRQGKPVSKMGEQCSRALKGVLATLPWPVSMRSCSSVRPRVLKHSCLILHVLKAETLLFFFFFFFFFLSLLQPSFHLVSHSDFFQGILMVLMPPTPSPIAASDS